MISAEVLRQAAMAAQTHVQRLCDLIEHSTGALEIAEQRAESAEAEVKRLKDRQKKLKTAPADLVDAARALLGRLDTITTEQFARGEERDEREALRQVLELITDSEGGQ